MDYLQFIAALTRSLAWQITVIVAILLLRKPLSELIVSLRLLKYKDLQLEFDRKLDAAGTDAANIVQQSLEPTGPKLEAIEGEQPWKQIMDAWPKVEEALRALAQNAGISVSPESNPLSLTQALEQKRRIDPATRRIIEELYDLRNSAVHSGGGNLITPAQAKRYLTYAGIVIWSLNARMRKV